MFFWLYFHIFGRLLAQISPRSYNIDDGVRRFQQHWQCHGTHEKLSRLLHLKNLLRLKKFTLYPFNLSVISTVTHTCGSPPPGGFFNNQLGLFDFFCEKNML